MSTRQTDAPSAIDEMLEQLQSRHVLVPSPFEVKDYLSRYPELADLVARIAHSAGRRFGEQAQLSLELYRDPEIEDEYITLYVRMVKYEAAIMDMIEKIRDEFAEDLAEMRGWLLLTTDFQLPR
jgi:hypothetical protein